MKAYLIITGALFGLIAVMHCVHAISDRAQLTTSPGEYLFKTALGLVAVGLSGWAWALRWVARRRRELSA
jgi:hypothetical protein